jgi:hypothetical protein
MSMSTTWEAFRRSVGMGLTRFHFRQRQEEIVSFTGSLSGARHALLIMPVGRMESSPYTMLINTLKRKFPERGLTVITWGPSLELMQLLPHSHFIRVLETEISRFYLPTREMMMRIGSTKYDVAIDLNLDLVLPSGYICRESGARVRVGFTGKWADLFYNLQIQRQSSPVRQQVYDRLAACLEMF